MSSYSLLSGLKLNAAQTALSSLVFTSGNQNTVKSGYNDLQGTKKNKSLYPEIATTGTKQTMKPTYKFMGMGG